MSTIVCQGLQPHSESQLRECRTLKLKLSSPKTVLSLSLEMALQSCAVPADYSKKLDSPLSPNMSGWSSLQNLPSITPETLCKKLKAPYVHPSAKRASWWLSDKSLNLCTENLGSETGSEFIENSIFSSPPACSTAENNKKIQVKKEQQQPRNRQVPQPKKQFPPPLTVLSDPACIDIRPQREDGRLILKATRSTPARRSCFQVYRSNGRLRLSVADSGMNMCSSEEDEDNEVWSNQTVIITNEENKYKNEKLEIKNSPELAACSSYEEETSSMEVERDEMKKLLDHKRRGASSNSSCRCNERHNNKTTQNKVLMTAMVKLEPPHFLVASS